VALRTHARVDWLDARVGDPTPYRQRGGGGGAAGELSLPHPSGLLTALVDVSGEGVQADALGADRTRLSAAAAVADDLSLAGGRVRLAPALRADVVGGFAGVSGKLGLAWRLGEVVALRAGAGRSFRAPSLAELHFQQGVVLPNPDLVPESGLAVDAAVVADGPLGLASLGGHVTRYRDLILYEPTSLGRLRAQNAGQALVSGLEAELATAPLLGPARASLSGAYTLLLTEILRGAPGEAGNWIPYRPRHRLYARAAAAPGPLEAHVEAHYVGLRYQDRRNLRPVPATLLWNAGASVRLWGAPAVRLHLDVKNLLDDRTLTDGLGNRLPHHGRNPMTRRLPLLAALAALAGLTGCPKDNICPVGEVACHDRCVDLASDAANCGGCGVTCDARATCEQSSCRCGPGLTLCGGACVDLLSDAAHCGACATACTPGQVCSTSAGVTACAGACAAGLTDCGGACVDEQADRYHCGACGVACAAGESCVAGACASLQVACFATDEVRAVAPDLATRATPRAAGDGPIALAALGGDVWAAASISGSVVRLPLDLSSPSVEKLLGGSDFEYLAADAGKLVIANSGAGSVVVFDPAAGKVVDELPLGATAAVNPRGIAFAAGKAYVSLYGDSLSGDPAVGQSIAVLDAADLATCGQAGGPTHCLAKLATLPVAAGADAPGLPFPGRSVVAGGKVYVSLANLKKGSFGYYTDPAGPGRLAVVDTAAGDAVSYVTLTGCENPGGLALHGTTLWVACGAFGASGLAEVDLAPAAPALVAVHATPIIAPGNVAFCGDRGFVTDQYSGDVYPFDPVSYDRSAAAATTVCPVSAGQGGFAWAADVLCATRP
jgi:hypothetical protein